MTGLPRLIATDLDGTLAMPDGSISPRAAKAFAAATAAGSVVILVTGRPVRWLSRVYEHIARYPAVCSNGAVVYDPIADEVLSATLIPTAELPAACERIRAAVPGSAFAVEIDGSRRMVHEPGFPLRSDRNDPAVGVATIDEMAGTDAVKLLVRASGWDSDVLNAAVRGAIGTGQFEITYSSPDGLVELAAAGVDKGSGLAAYAEGLGLGPADVLVFGDMPNDLPMFAWAGGAVAVANAHPSVLAAATAVTLPLEQDGVAAYLETLLTT